MSRLDPLLRLADRMCFPGLGPLDAAADPAPGPAPCAAAGLCPGSPPAGCSRGAWAPGVPPCGARCSSARLLRQAFIATMQCVDVPSAACRFHTSQTSKRGSTKDKRARDPARHPAVAGPTRKTKESAASTSRRTRRPHHGTSHAARGQCPAAISSVRFSSMALPTPGSRPLSCRPWRRGPRRGPPGSPRTWPRAGKSTPRQSPPPRP